jgi:hypothetical protein
LERLLALPALLATPLTCRERCDTLRQKTSGASCGLETDSVKKFSAYKTSRNGKEQLIDVELWVEDGKWRFLGVWRSARWPMSHCPSPKRWS